MKVGIMTWHEYENYGSVLQLYAMSEVLKAYGQDPLIINYHARKPGKNLGEDYSLKSIVKRINARFFDKIYVSEKKTELYKKFLQEKLVFTEPCNTLSELERLNEQFDCFVCGSDQIWAPSCFDPHYFLDFVDDPNRMFSYAPSIGLPKINNEYVKERVKELASRFVYLSTREKCGSDIISQLIENPVETVLDPTLLISSEEWRALINDSDDYNEPYMLVYLLGNNRKYWKLIKSAARKLKIKIKVIPVYSKDCKNTYSIQENVGPVEFLKYINNASYICTDSFHGTIFSILFKKKFCTFKRFKQKDPNNQNSRIYSILSEVGLINNIYTEKNTIDGILSAKIDYKSVEEKLEHKILESREFIYNAIHKIDLYNNDNTKKHLNNINYNLSLCCGCGVCLASCKFSAIDIRKDEEGFYKAYINEDNCVSCGKCREVCPYIRTKTTKCEKGHLYSYKDSSKEVLLKSSSGGAAFALSCIGISEGYAIAGAAFDNKNIVKHIFINDISELNRIQGSKYLQSDFSNISLQLKKYKNSIIFGTPCQIAGIRNICDEKKCVLVDLVCHGVPSYNLYESYNNFLSEEYGIKSEKINTVFRYKKKGWRKIHLYSSDGEKNICLSQDKDPFFLLFEHGVCYSKACFECPWREKSAADIRIGDYWGNRFRNDNTGVSMVLSLTDKGLEFVSKLKNSNRGTINETNIKDYITVQQLANVSEPLFRKEIIAKLKSGERLENIIRKYIIKYIIIGKAYKIVDSIRYIAKKNKYN